MKKKKGKKKRKITRGCDSDVLACDRSFGERTRTGCPRSRAVGSPQTTPQPQAIAMTTKSVLRGQQYSTKVVVGP